MEPWAIISLAIGVLVGSFFLILGIRQIRSKKPVGFYTGEEPPSEKILKDVRSWNTGHGLLWIGYGIIVIGCYVLAVFATSDPLVRTLLMFCGTIFPIALLVLGHHLLIKKLKIM